MHVILKQYLDDFCNSFEYQEYNESDQFELFCNYCVTSRKYLGRFEPRSITTLEDDAGIDGIAFIIDGELILTEDDAEIAFNTHKTSIPVDVIINQVKSGEKFDKQEIANYKIGIEDFLSLAPCLPNGKMNLNCIEIFKKILNNLKKIKNRRPNVSIYYCTGGTYRAEREVKGAFDVIERYVKELDYFNEVEVIPYGRSELIKLWTSINEKNEAKLKLIEYMGIDSMPDIPQAYVGLVRAKDFINCVLCDPEGNLKEEVFDENIRAFLGEDNDVNQEIEQTLLDEQKKQKFSVLNNGITIIAPELSVTPNTKEIDLTNYQIINGCQTSNILYLSRHNINDDVKVVIKFIESPNPDVAADIITATNSQSQIATEAFHGLKGKAKLIQKYFDAKNDNCSSDSKIYFERRQKEYREKNYQVTRIFDVREVARSFSAMFLGQPYNSARYVKKIFTSSGDLLFREEHHESPYYCAVLTLYKYNTLINGRKIGANKYNKLRWHIIMLFKYVVHSKVEELKPDSRAIDKYSQKIIDVLISEDKSYIKYFQKCQNIIDMLDLPTDDSLKRAKYTTELIGKAKTYLSSDR
jgi:hypothetical protein